MLELASKVIKSYYNCIPYFQKVNKDIEYIFKRPKSNLEIKTTTSEMKNIQKGIYSRLHIVIEKISELEDSNKNYPNETRLNKKKDWKKKQSINEL